MTKMKKTTKETKKTKKVPKAKKAEAVVEAKKRAYNKKPKVVGMDLATETAVAEKLPEEASWRLRSRSNEVIELGPQPEVAEKTSEAAKDSPSEGVKDLENFAKEDAGVTLRGYALVDGRLKELTAAQMWDANGSPVENKMETETGETLSYSEESALKEYLDNLRKDRLALSQPLWYEVWYQRVKAFVKNLFSF